MQGRTKSPVPFCEETAGGKQKMLYTVSGVAERPELSSDKRALLQESCQEAKTTSLLSDMCYGFCAPSSHVSSWRPPVWILWTFPPNCMFSPSACKQLSALQGDGKRTKSGADKSSPFIPVALHENHTLSTELCPQHLRHLSLPPATRSLHQHLLHIFQLIPPHIFPALCPTLAFCSLSL